MFHSAVLSWTGEEWWLTTAASSLLEWLRSLPLDQFREPQPADAPSAIGRFGRLSFLVPWRDADVSVPPVDLNVTLGAYIERAQISLVLPHVLPALLVVLGGLLLGPSCCCCCGRHQAAVWRR